MFIEKLMQKMMSHNFFIALEEFLKYAEKYFYIRYLVR